jgi:hypothetical protein
MTILVALLSIFVGIGLLFAGYRVARFIIPFMGFLAGLSIGGAVISNMADTPFLGTALGIIVGLGAGLFLAALAYLYYYVAVLVLAGAIGYWLGSGVILMFGVDPNFWSALFGVAGGLLFGILALIGDFPKYLLIALSAIGGAVVTVGGLMLLLHVIPLEVYSYTATHFAIANSFLWTVITLVLLGVGIAFQSSTTNGYLFHEWAMGDDRHHKMPPSTTSPTLQH